MAYEHLADWYVKSNGAYGAGYPIDSPTMSGSENVFTAGVGPSNTIAKATTAYERGTTTAFDPYYSARAIVWPLRDPSFFSAINKTTYKEKKDAVKVITADHTAAEVTSGFDPTDTTLFASYGTPTIFDIDGADSLGVRPKTIYTRWIMDLDYILKNQFQHDPTFDAEWAKSYYIDKHNQELDVMMLTSVDTTADLNIESLDRVISSSAEEAYVDAGDGDIYGIDRGTGSTYDAQVDTTSASRVLSLDMIDDVLAAAQPYSSGVNNHIGIIHPLVLNMIQDLTSSRQRYSEGAGDYKLTVNGISTRQGHEIGFQVATYTGGGLGPIPLIPDNNVAIAGTCASKGSAYFYDNEHLELRTALPQSFYETSESDFAILAKAQKRYMILYAAELIADRFNCHAGVKSLSGV